MEVRVFRSYRSHSRRCYGLSFTHFSLSAQAKGCYSSSGQRELRGNFTHSSLPLLVDLGVPNKSSLRLLLRPGPQRWALGMGLFAGPWGMDLNMGLRLERPGLYGWHGLLKFGTRSVRHTAEITGRMRFESWCHIWVDAAASWGSVTSTLFASIRCHGVGRLVWVHGGRVEDVPHKTTLNVQGHIGVDGLKGSLGLESDRDSFQCILSVLLKGQKAEVGWTLQHRWASLASAIPNRLDLQGSGQLSDASLSGSAEVLFDAHSAQIDVNAAWEPSATLRVTIQQNLASTGVPGELNISISTTASQAEVEVESDVCSIRVLANRHRREVDRRRGWNIFAHQRCTLLKVREETRTVQGNLFPSWRKAKDSSSPGR